MNEKEFIKKERERLTEESKRAVKRIICRKCGGVVIKNYMMALASRTYGDGKKCHCKYLDFPADKEGRFRKER